MAAIDPDRAADAIALPDGGYLGSLAVYHELHCLVSNGFLLHILLSLSLSLSPPPQEKSQK